MGRCLACSSIGYVPVWAYVMLIINSIIRTIKTTQRVQYNAWLYAEYMDYEVSDAKHCNVAWPCHNKKVGGKPLGCVFGMQIK